MTSPPANSPPLCGTHTDAEFAALKAELEHYKAISRTLSIDTHINVPFKQWKQLREELAALKAELAASQAQVARLQTALEEINREATEAMDGFLDDAPGVLEHISELSTTATAAQAGKETKP